MLQAVAQDVLQLYAPAVDPSNSAAGSLVSKKSYAIDGALKHYLKGRWVYQLYI